MKYLAIFFILCNPLILEQSSNSIQNKEFSYDEIFKEITKIDTTKYYLNYEIDNDLFKDYIQIIEKSKKIGSKEISFLKKQKSILSQFTLSKKYSNLIKKSQKNCHEKTEINYVLSNPQFIGKDKILIMNSILYRKDTNNIKGGIKRIFIYKKVKESWSFQEKINLIEI